MNNRYVYHSYLKKLVPTLVLTLVASSCGELPETFVPSQTDKFDVYNADTYKQADSLLQADYVFVLDYSYSMKDKSANIVQSMELFGDYLKEAGIDYRVGIINGNIHANQVTTVSKNFLGPILSLESHSEITSLISAQVEPIGADLNPNTNLLLESAHKTMLAKASQFLRPAAQLVYVFVSDSDDISDVRINENRAPEFYKTELSKHKSNNSYVSARSFTAGIADNCTPTSGIGGDSAGLRIAQTAQLLDASSDFQAAANGCVYSTTDEQLRNISRDVTKYEGRFLIRGTPLNQEIRVFVNNVEVPSEGNWAYHSANNELIFIEGKEPEKNASISIAYDQGFFLTRKPKLDTVEILVDGKSVPQSEGSGWTYIEEDNRIAFSTAAKPNNGSKILITYQNAK